MVATGLSPEVNMVMVELVAQPFALKGKLDNI